MVYVTVGTMFLDFPRLILKMDQVADSTGEKVIIQIGLGPTTPQHCDFFDFKPRDEILALQEEARVIVCHAGIGSVMDALGAGRPLIVVPRLKKLNEHMNDHQLDLAQAVERRAWGRMILDIDGLDEALAHPQPALESYATSKHRLIGAIRDKIDRVAASKG